jgi:hypothetical protein
LGPHLEEKVVKGTGSGLVTHQEGDAYNFENFQDILRNEGGVVGVPKEWEKVAFSNRYEALSSVKVGFQILRILPRDWQEHYHIKGLQTVC